MAKPGFLVILLTALSLSSPAQAHYMWLERDGDGPARAYFDEWVDDVREKSGGLLDRVKAPGVTLGGGNELLSVKRNADNLEIAVTGAGDLRLVDDNTAPRRVSRKATPPKQFITPGRAVARRWIPSNEPRQALRSPVLAHLRMDEVLIDSRKLLAQHVVQHPDNLRTAFHFSFSRLAARVQHVQKLDWQ